MEAQARALRCKHSHRNSCGASTVRRNNSGASTPAHLQLAVSRHSERGVLTARRVQPQQRWHCCRVLVKHQNSAGGGCWHGAEDCACPARDAGVRLVVHPWHCMGSAQLQLYLGAHFITPKSKHQRKNKPKPAKGRIMGTEPHMRSGSANSHRLTLTQAGCGACRGPPAVTACH